MFGTQLPPVITFFMLLDVMVMIVVDNFNDYDGFHDDDGDCKNHMTLMLVMRRRVLEKIIRTFGDMGVVDPSDMLE